MIYASFDDLWCVMKVNLSIYFGETIPFVLSFILDSFGKDSIGVDLFREIHTTCSCSVVTSSKYLNLLLCLYGFSHWGFLSSLWRCRAIM